MRLKLIANPVAGRGARERVCAVAQQLRNLGHEVALVWTGRRGDARQLAAQAPQEGCDRLLVAGGDGTLNEALNGLVGSELPVAFLPLGTTNVLALELGLPRELSAAARLACAGEVAPVCLGRAGTEHFLLMAGVGFDGEAVRRVSLPLKRRTGKFAYAVSALSAFLCAPGGRIEVRDETGRRRIGYGAVVSNGRLYGGRFVLNPQASIFADRLDVCLFLRPGRLALLSLALRVLSGGVPGPPLVEHFAARRLEFTGARLPVQLDGDDCGDLPLTIEVVPDAVRLVLSPGSRA